MVCFFLVIVIFCVILFCVQVIYVDSVCFFFQDFIYNFEVKVEEVVFVEEFVNYDYMRVQILDNGIFEDQIVFSDFFDVDSLVDFGILNQQGLSDDQVVFLEENLGFEFVFFFSVKEDNFYVYDVQKDFFFLEFVDFSNIQGIGFDIQEFDFGIDDFGFDVWGFVDDGVVFFNESINSLEL